MIMYIFYKGTIVVPIVICLKSQIIINPAIKNVLIGLLIKV